MDGGDPRNIIPMIPLVDRHVWTSALNRSPMVRPGVAVILDAKPRPEFPSARPPPLPLYFFTILLAQLLSCRHFPFSYWFAIVFFFCCKVINELSIRFRLWLCFLVALVVSPYLRNCFARRFQDSSDRVAALSQSSQTDPGSSQLHRPTLTVEKGL